MNVILFMYCYIIHVISYFFPLSVLTDKNAINFLSGYYLTVKKSKAWYIYIIMHMIREYTRADLKYTIKLFISR